MKFFYTGVIILLLLPVTVGAALSPDDIQKHYTQGTMRILVVPGHTNVEWGTSYRGLREADVTKQFALYLAEYLQNDKKISTFVTRDNTGEFSPWLQYFMDNNKAAVISFRDSHYAALHNAFQNGSAKRVDGVYHNVAPSKSGYELNAINFFANNNAIDIVLHIHFNDHPRKNTNIPGKYTGLAIYIPEEQLPNHVASKSVAEVLFNQLSKFMPTSDLPGEKSGIVHDQDLIAVGSAGTRDGASMLVEYGYIYEPQFRDSEVRDVYLREMAFQTYLGIEKLFGVSTSTLNVKPTFLPHVFVAGTQSRKETLLLQFALASLGSYPPSGKSLHDCPTSGVFGQCTIAALQEFKQKNGSNKALLSKVIKNKLDISTVELLNSFFAK